MLSRYHYASKREGHSEVIPEARLQVASRSVDHAEVEDVRSARQWEGGIA